MTARLGEGVVCETCAVASGRFGGVGRLDGDPVLLILGLSRAPARQVHNRPCASRKMSAAGQLDAKASLTRRTLTVTSAPIFRSASRIVPHVARSILVPASPRRRNAHRST